LYGRPPTQLSPEIIEMIIEGEPITGRPADLLEPMLEKARQEIAEHIQQPEDVLTYVLFPEIAKKFFESRNA
jgi:oxaloacetate decarboxylase alpha subunit